MRGVIPILHTCWRADGALDEAAVRAQIAWVLATGADGVGIALASDILRMSAEERLGLFGLVTATVAGRVPVVCSVGADTPELAARFAAGARSAGAAAVMAIPPRDAADEPARRAYFETILAACPLPLIIQDASGYVGEPMTPEFQAGFLERHGPDRILFKPEADPVGPLITRLHELTGRRGRIFEGSGGSDLVANHARGLTGTMPGCDLLDAIVPLWAALERGDATTVARLREPVEALARLQAGHGLDGYLAVERHLMRRRGLFPSDRMRHPDAWTPDAALRNRIDGLFDRLREAVRGVE